MSAMDRKGKEMRKTVKMMCLVFVLLAASVILTACGSDDKLRQRETETVFPAVETGGRFTNPFYDFNIVVDRETGVNYLIYSEGMGNSSRGGITVLVNADGSPVVTPVTETVEETETDCE